MSGGGTIEADGGGNEVGGGGGRIAVYVNTLSFPTNRATAAGGAGYGGGGAGAVGTVYFGIPPAPPMPPGMPPVITLFAFLPPAVPPPPGSPPASLSPTIQWNVPDGASGGIYKIQFSPTLYAPSWTTLEERLEPLWTGSLPAGTERGFLRILRED